MKLLIIEDDNSINSLLTQAFSERGDSVDSALNAEDGIYLIEVNSYDVIILDWMLPDKSGIEALKEIRAKSNNIPVLMLTAKDSEKDIVKGLESGADDYLIKPFSLPVLFARVDVLYRRASIKSVDNSIEFLNFRVDISSKTLYKNNQKIEISLKEYELLMLLLKNKNSYISKDYIYDNLWSNEEFIASNVIEVTIYNLRKKLGKDVIKSYRGLGYKIED